MARSFNGSSNYMSVPETATTGTAWTLAVISSHNSLANGAVPAIVSIPDTSAGSVDRSISCYYRGDLSGDPVQNRWVDNTLVGSRQSSGGYSTNTLQSIIARGDSANASSIFLDGVKTTGVTTNVMVGSTAMKQLTVGAYVSFSGVYQEFVNGSIAMVAYWGAALTDDECIALSKGFSPKRIRPQSLRKYLPLVRDAVELKTGATVTTNGSPGVTAHPRTYGAF